jgi:hypothetical protein
MDWVGNGCTIFWLLPSIAARSVFLPACCFSDIDITRSCLTLIPTCASGQRVRIGNSRGPPAFGLVILFGKLSSIVTFKD